MNKNKHWKLHKCRTYYSIVTLRITFDLAGVHVSMRHLNLSYIFSCKHLVILVRVKIPLKQTKQLTCDKKRNVKINIRTLRGYKIKSATWTYAGAQAWSPSTNLQSAHYRYRWWCFLYVCQMVQCWTLAAVSMLHFTLCFIMGTTGETLNIGTPHVHMLSKRDTALGGLYDNIQFTIHFKLILTESEKKLQYVYHVKSNQTDSLDINNINTTHI